MHSCMLVNLSMNLTLMKHKHNQPKPKLKCNSCLMEFGLSQVDSAGSVTRVFGLWSACNLYRIIKIYQICVCI